MSSGNRKGTPGRGWDDFQVSTECILSRKVLVRSRLVVSCLGHQAHADGKPAASNRGAKAVRKRDWLARLMPVWPGLGRTARLVASPARRRPQQTPSLCSQRGWGGIGSPSAWHGGRQKCKWEVMELLWLLWLPSLAAALAALAGHEMLLLLLCCRRFSWSPLKPSNQPRMLLQPPGPSSPQLPVCPSTTTHTHPPLLCAQVPGQKA